MNAARGVGDRISCCEIRVKGDRRLGRVARKCFVAGCASLTGQSGAQSLHVAGDTEVCDEEVGDVSLGAGVPG